MGNYLNYSFPMGDRSSVVVARGRKGDGARGERGGGAVVAAKEDHLIKSR